MTGGSTSGGTPRMAPATFSRTSLAASSRLRSSTKRTVMLALPPACTLACSWSMPAMPLSAFSIGITTDVVISSGDAPGSCSRTLTVAGSAFGNRSTPRSRNEKIPRTTSDVTSIVANTGRRTQSSDSIGLLHLPLGGHLHPVGEVVHVGHRDQVTVSHPGQNLDAIAEPIAHLHLMAGDAVALDHERAVDAVVVLQ